MAYVGITEIEKEDYKYCSSPYTCQGKITVYTGKFCDNNDDLVFLHRSKIQMENAELKKTLSIYDLEVNAKRDSLPSLKSKRDALRNANSRMRQKNGLVGNESLLRDFEIKKVHIPKAPYCPYCGLLV